MTFGQKQAGDADSRAPVAAKTGGGRPRRYLHGIGRANYRNILYEGQFVNDRWHGYGRAIFQDGSYHIGYWADDKKCGWGVSTRKHRRTGEKIVEQGHWDRNGCAIKDEPISEDD